ncbi:hypothetical protein ABK040_000718 [Willaertia magna]
MSETATMGGKQQKEEEGNNDNDSSSNIRFTNNIIEKEKNVLDNCIKLKEEGNLYFKEKQYEKAIHVYTTTISKILAELKHSESSSQSSSFSAENINKTQEEKEEINKEIHEEEIPNNDTINNNNEIIEEEEQCTLMKEEEEDISLLFKEIITNENLKELIITLYSNLSLCYFQLSAFQKSLDYCNFILKDLNQMKHLKSYFKRSQCHENLNQFQLAFEDIKKCIELIKEEEKENKQLLNLSFIKKLNEDYKRLEKLAEEEKKKQMNEMLGQVKDLGNQFLGLFGLSLDNFKVNQNSESGGFNISMNNK